MSSDADPMPLELDGVALVGSLALPEDDLVGLVVLLRVGNHERPELEREVARRLNRAGFGTLRLGLVTAEEARDEERALELRFDIPLLARRLLAAIEWVLRRFPVRDRIGLFATDTAGAAALVAAARRPELVDAVVLLQGRPDLAVSAVNRLVAPTLLIAGGSDEPAIHSNEIAACHFHGPHKLRIVPGTGKFTGQRGSIDACAELARRWFTHHLVSGDLSQVG